MGFNPIDYALTTGVSTLIYIIENAPPNSKYRAIIRKVFQKIVSVYGADAEFKKIAQEGLK